MEFDIVTVQAVFAMIILFVACYFDVRYREVPNIFWWVMGLAGIATTAYRIFETGFDWRYVLFVAGTLLIFYDILINENEKPIVRIIIFAAIGICFIVPMVTEFDYASKLYLMTLVSYVFVYVLYVLKILKGGADAKCLITVGMLVQTCPSGWGLPLISVPTQYQFAFPFPFMLLLFAAAITMLYLFWIILRKVIRKKDSVKLITLSCYTMSIEEARKSHVWAKQDVKDGMIVNVNYIPDDAVYDRLEKAGAKEVWVTPIIPFLVPMFLAFVFLFVVGNPFFIPFS